MADLERERYISVTTFRRDASPVATPVWVVGDGSRLYIWTGAQSGKVKRIRRNPDVTVAPCTARGVVRGPSVRAHAEIVQAADHPEIWQLFLAKYGLQLRAILLSGRIRRLLRSSQAPDERVLLRLTPAE